MSMVVVKLGGGFKNVFGMFTSKIGEDAPILTSICFFQMGWFNHQLEECLLTKIRKPIVQQGGFLLYVFGVQENTYNNQGVKGSLGVEK